MKNRCILHGRVFVMKFLFSGVLMGMSNTLGTVPGFLGPEIVGVLTEKNVSKTENYKSDNLAKIYLF